MLSYGDVSLIVPDAEISDWIAKNQNPADVMAWLYPSWPGSCLTNITYPTGFYPNREICVNRLYWYTGASRWAYGFFLCSTDDLEPIMDAAFTTTRTGPSTPLDLVMDLTEKITTSMYLLPPMPLSGVRAVNGMYLLPLVDVRFFWWQFPCPAFNIPTPNTTVAWTDLYSAISSTLSDSIAVDSIPSAYLKPSPILNQHYEAVPIVLDAIATNCGQKIVRSYAGVVRAMNVTNGAAQVTSNFAETRTIRSGGRLFADVL